MNRRGRTQSHPHPAGREQAQSWAQGGGQVAQGRPGTVLFPEGSWKQIGNKTEDPDVGTMGDHGECHTQPTWWVQGSSSGGKGYPQSGQERGVPHSRQTLVTKDFKARAPTLPA